MVQIIESLWIYPCSSKRKWFYSFKVWPTTELQKKKIQIPSIQCPSWIDSCLFWQPHLGLFSKNSCVLGILKKQGSSYFHSYYLLCLNTFPNLPLWNIYSYFKTKTKHHFLIIYFPIFSSPLYSRKHPGHPLLYYIWNCFVYIQVYSSHFWEKGLDFLHNPRT